MSIEAAMLGVISWYPCSGYDMKIEFEKGGPGLFWALSFGSIYPKLEELEKAGLVEVVPGEPEARNKKIYDLTGEGWEYLSQWLTESPAYPLPLRDELLLKFSFWGSNRPDDRTTLIGHLQERRAKSKEWLAYLIEWPTNGYSSISEYGMLAIKYMQSKLESELAWIEMAIKQLEGPAQPPVQDPDNLMPRQQERKALALKKLASSPGQSLNRGKSKFRKRPDYDKK